jgi:hypothetical protein
MGIVLLYIDWSSRINLNDSVYAQSLTAKENM